MKRSLLISLITVTAMALTASAASIDEAKNLYNSGLYQQALAQLNELIKKQPKDVAVNYYLGATLSELGERSRAKSYLETAAAKGSNEAYEQLAANALHDYDTDSADDYLDDLNTRLAKAKKKTQPSKFAKELQRRSIAIKNMLDRVEKIVIVDSIDVDANSFFKAYKLSAEAGRVCDISDLPAKVNGSDQSTAFVPAGGREMFWSARDSAKVLTLMHAGVLDDGTVEAPSRLSENIAPGVDAAFPFMMADGQTLYYAAKGDGSIGGYDIFMTRRDDDGTYLDGSNLGMPYNSPYNDYLLAIDETTGLGWWATDRSAAPGHVTIFVFIPNETRVNYDPDTENLGDLALVRSISATQPDGFDKAAALSPLNNLTEGSASTAGDREFTLSMGNGKVYTRLADFRNDNARREMQTLIKEQAALDNDLARLASLRRQYKQAGPSKATQSQLATQIKTLESSTAEARRRLTSRRNTVIRLETK